MKKISGIMLAVMCCALMFAEPKSSGLTDSDVKNWAKNLSTIQKEFDKAGLNSEEIATAGKKDYAKAEAILQKSGISAPDSVEKYAMINQCSTLLVAEEEMGSADSKSMAMMKAMGLDPLAQLKETVNSKDYQIVKANKKAVISAVKGYSDSMPVETSNDNFDYDPYAKQRELIKKQIQPEIDGINKAAASIKQVYDYLSTGKKAGAGKLLNPVKDKKNSSKYIKQKIDAAQLPIEINCYDFYYESKSALDEMEVQQVLATINLKKNTAVFKFSWTEAEFDGSVDPVYGSIRGLKTTKFTKTVKTTIKASELYVFENNSMGGTSKEFVLTTKEGAVIHLWNSMSFDGNAYSSVVQFGDIIPPEDTNWYEDNGY